jgi:hypothetical protein
MRSFSLKRGTKIVIVIAVAATTVCVVFFGLPAVHQALQGVHITKVIWDKPENMRFIDLELYLHVGDDSFPAKVRVLLDGEDIYTYYIDPLFKVYHVADDEVYLTLLRFNVNYWDPMETQNALNDWCNSSHTVKILDPSSGKNLFSGDFHIESVAIT